MPQVFIFIVILGFLYLTHVHYKYFYPTKHEEKEAHFVKIMCDTDKDAPISRFTISDGYF